MNIKRKLKWYIFMTKYKLGLAKEGIDFRSCGLDEKCRYCNGDRCLYDADIPSGDF